MSNTQYLVDILEDSEMHFEWESISESIINVFVQMNNEDNMKNSLLSNIWSFRKSGFVDMMKITHNLNNEDSILKRINKMTGFYLDDICMVSTTDKLFKFMVTDNVGHHCSFIMTFLRKPCDIEEFLEM